MSQAEDYIIPSIVFVPLSVIITFTIPSFWRWIESLTGINCIGHFGPAMGCFALIYALLISAFSLYYFFIRERNWTSLRLNREVR